MDRDALVDSIVAGLNGGVGPTEHGPSSWVPVDLTDALAGLDLPRPQLVRRTDGVPLVYRGKLHWLHGESESCKTWLAILAAAQVLDDGGRALWIDFEDDDRTVVARLRSVAVTVDAIAARFVYLRPDEPLTDRTQRITTGGVDLALLLERERFDLAVIDGVTEAMVTEGLNGNDNAEIAIWLRRLPRRLTATGAATLAVDHVTKDRDSRGRYAIGGQHKLAGLDGAAYSFEVVKAFARPTGTDPATGTVRIKVVKDRGGWIRGKAIDDRVATMELTSYPDGGVTIALAPPDACPTPDLALCRRIAEYLATYDGASQNSIEKGVEGHSANLRDALRWMVEEPRVWLRVEKVGQSYRHYLMPAIEELGT